ncbi:MAG: dihydrofolate reductase [Rhodospirillales bacterium]|nr:dihydrofolate reductase [Rhodospirillales bacterium]
MTKITVSAIAAMAQNRVIGKDNDLPWRIPGDLAHYKRTTMGKPLVMGRKSYEALGKPLPGRTNIVVSRALKIQPAQDTTHFDMMESVLADLTAPHKDQFLIAQSLEDAIEGAKKVAIADGVDEIFINGGGQIYRAAMPYVERLYMTLIHRDYDGDTTFPEINWDEWMEISNEDFLDNDPPYSIKVLERK